jgi:putative nucleotidyltransferase with HDIG domain
MSWRPRARTSPPRLIVRTTIATFTMVACLMASVFVVLLVDARQRVRDSVATQLAAGQRVFSTFDQRRRAELQSQIALLADSPTLKAALDTFAATEDAPSGIALQLKQTVQRELAKLTERFSADVFAIVDSRLHTVAVAGPSRAAWPPGYRLPHDRGLQEAGDAVVTLPGGAFHTINVPLLLGDVAIGSLHVATALDDEYATRLAELAGTQAIVLLGGRVAGSTLRGAAAVDVAALASAGLSAEDVVTLAGAPHAIRRVLKSGALEAYVLGSIDAAAAGAMRQAFLTILWIGAGALVLAGAVSVVLARAQSRPIDRLTRQILAMREAGRIDSGVAPTGASFELDTLANTFNDLMLSVAQAQQETRAAYVGTIRALAAALDARDPYTAGHSERVSALSTAIGRTLQLPQEELEVLRLGALLHDIGKIGISDHVLRKPGRLTADERGIIEQHPTLGARILGPVAFLQPYIPVVELHHENPDGSGYPHGLRGEQVPLVARIAHVADAFDAMTSARSYRPARSAQEAVAELWRCSGSQFDAEVVAALVRTVAIVGATDFGAVPTPAAIDTAGQDRVLPFATATASGRLHP